MTVQNKIRAVGELIRLQHQYGTLLLMMPTLWSLFLAGRGRPPVGLIVVFVVGSFLMRSAGCVMNDLADRRLDRFVARTRDRPIPSGRLSVAEAVCVLLVLLLLSAFLLVFLNTLTRELSLVALAVAGFYPFSKRLISLPQAVLGITFSWGAVMAWAAVRNELGWISLLILLANLCWTVGYDTIYALMDREDDRTLGIGSSAILFGKNAWAWVGLLYTMMVFFLAWLGQGAGLGEFYRFSLLLISGMLAFQITILKTDPPQNRLFALFKSNVGVGILVLLGIFFDLTP